MESGWLVHSIRTALASTCSLGFARLFNIPQPYWAAVTTLVVMQSTLGASWKVSTRRIAGTALGAVAGGLVASSFGMNVILFAIVLFLLGVLCGILRLDPSAYRFAGITFAIVTLVSHIQYPPWVIAGQRFAEVCIGIIVALALVAVWPTREVKS